MSGSLCSLGSLTNNSSNVEIFLLFVYGVMNETEIPCTKYKQMAKNFSYMG